MKKQHLLATLLLAVCVNTAVAKVEWVDRIAIIVNQDVITERDISDMEKNLKNTFLKGKAPATAELRQAAMEQLIDKKLILQIARQNNIRATDAEIDQMLAQIAQQQGTSTEKVYASIAKEGVSREVLRRTIGENIIVGKITQQETTNSAQVSDAELAQFLAKNPQTPTISRYDVRHILIKTDTRSDAQARNELLQVRAQLKKGASFESLAERFSQDTASAKNGGKIGWISRGMSTPEFDKVLVGMKVGQVSQPIKSGFGWHLIRLDDTRQDAMSEEERNASARAFIAEQKAPKAYQTWLQHLRSAAYIDFRKKPY